MIARLLRLSLGLWSPSRIMAIGMRDVGAAAGWNGEPPPAPSPLSWLDRWEVRNHARDCEARGRDPMLPTPEVAAGLDWAARMMRGEMDEEDEDPPSR